MTTTFRWALRSVFFVLAELVCIPIALGESDAVRTVLLPFNGIDFAMHPDSGALAVVRSGVSSVVVYPKFAAAGELAVGLSVSVPNSPTAIAFKRLPKGDVFAVICSPANELAVLDAKTFQLLKTIPLGTKSTNPVIASNSLIDPCLYYFDLGRHPGTMNRVQLEKLVEQEPLNVGEAIMDGAVSHDGRIVYFRGASGPLVLRALEIIHPLPPKPALAGRLVHSESRGGIGCVPDSTGHFFASGETVYSGDLRRHIAKVDGRAALFFVNRPLLASISDEACMFYSTNSFKQLAKVPFRSESPPTRPGAARTSSNARVFNARRFLEGPGGRSLLLCGENTIQMINLDELKLPPEPILAFKVQGEQMFSVGRPGVVKLEPRESGTRVELREPRAGQTFVDGEFRWQPSDADVGAHEIGLKLSRDGIVADRTLKINVRRPSIDLGFAASALQISPDGHSAVVWESGSAWGPGRDQKTSSRLALLDLDAQSVIAERTFPNAIALAAVDRHYVYVAAQRSNAFYALDKKNLNDVRRVFTDKLVDAITPAGDRLVFIGQNQSGNGSPVAFKVPEFEAVAPAEIGIRIRASDRLPFSWPGPPQNLGGRWWYDGSLYDQSFSRLQALYRPSGFPVLELSGPNLHREEVGRGPPPRWLSPWGVDLLQAGDNPSQRFILGPAAALLPGLPAYVTLREVDQPSQGRESLMTVQLIVQDLMERNTVATIPLRIASTGRAPQTHSQQHSRLATYATTIVALILDQVFVIDLSKLALGPLPAPAHCKAEWPVISIRDADQTIPPPTLGGMTEPIEWSLWSLIENVRGIEVNPKNGALTVKPQQLVEQLITIIAERPRHESLQLASFLHVELRDGLSDADAIKDFMTGISDRYEKLVGKKPKDIPIWITIGLAARDKNNLRFEMDPGMFVEVPAEKLLARLARRSAQTDDSNPPGAPKATPSAESITALQRRIDDLERKVDQLSAKIDLLTQLLREKAAPAKPPEK